jgi:tetratricopeptide (TPR) repeat protein
LNVSTVIRRRRHKTNRVGNSVLSIAVFLVIAGCGRKNLETKDWVSADFSSLYGFSVRCPESIKATLRLDGFPPGSQPTFNSGALYGYNKENSVTITWSYVHIPKGMEETWVRMKLETEVLSMAQGEMGFKTEAEGKVLSGGHTVLWKRYSYDDPPGHAFGITSVWYCPISGKAWMLGVMSDNPSILEPMLNSYLTSFNCHSAKTQGNLTVSGSGTLDNSSKNKGGSVTSDILLAIECSENNEFEKARDISEKVLATYPNNRYALQVLAISLRECGEAIKSEEAWQRVLSIPLPKSPSADEAEILWRLTKLTARFQKDVYQVNPQALAYANMGAELCRSGKIQEGIEYLNKAIKIDPNCELAHYNLGISAYNQGKIELAITCMKEVLRINPNNLKAKSLLEELEK